MNRRTFIYNVSGLALSVTVLPSFVPFYKDKMDRIAMGTLLFRYRFKRTKPRELAAIKNELTLLDVPMHHRDKFGIKKIEFWNEHFESLDPTYLESVKKAIKAAKSELLNVQIDRIQYNLASQNEEERLKSIKDVKEWIDGVAILGSKCIRINPGRPNGTVEKSIQSLKELKSYADQKKLTIITANHFGIETDPVKHVAIMNGVGKGIYTEPDFGNYSSPSVILPSLEQILPYAHIVSAKVVDFNDQIEHVTYDFDKCVQLCENKGFKGVYMVSQWSSKFHDIDYDKVADWVITHLKDNMKS